MKRNRRQLVLLIVAICVAGATVGAVLARAGSSGAVRSYDATAAFSVFRNTPSVAVPGDLSSSQILSKTAEFAKTHELQRNLGRFSSRLLIFPGNAGQNVCYALLGVAPEDPAMSYCYSPIAQDTQHFNAAALQSRSDDGTATSVQVFGVAWDDVAHLRLQVGEAWRPVPIIHNGFYVDLPGVSLAQLGELEATLKGGGVQLHNVRTGLNG